MIEATFYTNEQDRIWSFEIHGHAGFAQNGDPDIVCAAVSALSLNTVNGLERFLKILSSMRWMKMGFYLLVWKPSV